MSDLTALTKRLEHGWALIDEANDAGDHIEGQRLCDHWVALLAEYQREADVTLWEIDVQHDWRQNMSSDTFSPVPNRDGAFIHAQEALLI